MSARVSRVALCALLLASLAGCGGAGGARSGGTHAANQGEAPHVVPGALDARGLLGDLPMRASKLGAGPLSIVATGVSSAGERMGAFVEVPETSCLLGYARASSSVEDLDAAALAEEGSPLATDEAPDAHPTILVCPPHPARIYLSAHTVLGEGLVALGAQFVPRELAPEITHALGARGNGGLRAADAWPGLDDEVSAHRRALGGTWEELRRVALLVDTRAPSSVGFPVEANQCIDVLVIPDDDVAALDVEALDGEGRVVGRVRDGDRARSMVLCSPVAFGGSLVVRPHGGTGVAAVVLGRAKAEVARDISTRVQIAWVGAAEPLESALRQRHAELAKAGYAEGSPPVRGALVLGRRSKVVLDLPGGGCHRIDVVGGTPTALLEGNVWDANGARVAWAEGSSGLTVFSCGHPKVDLEVEARGRPGPFAAVARPETWKDPAFAAHPLAAARMLTRAAPATAGKLDGVPLAVRALAVDAAHRGAFVETVRPGQCMTVILGGEGEGTGLELRLLDATTGDDLDRASGELSVASRVCAGPSGAKIRAEVRAAGGKMDVVVGERLAPP